MLWMLLAACAPPDDAGPWPGEDVRPALDHPFFDAHPLPDRSLYAVHVAGDDRPDAAHRGPLGVGNGKVFAMAGLTDPLNTLHGIRGPTYRTASRFFGDLAAVLEVDGERLSFDEEWIARPRGTGLVVTRADAGAWTLYTVDFALRAPGDDPLEVLPVIGRWLLVSGPGADDVRVRFEAARPLGTVDGLAADRNDADGMLLALAPWDGDLDGTVVDLGPVDDHAAAAVAIATADDPGHLAEVLAALPDPGEALDDTVAWWTDWSSTGVVLEGDDPRVADLYDGLRVAIRVQTSASGGVSPMSRYAGVWLRDTIGPVRFFTRAGLGGEAAAAVGYLHLCHRVRGDIGNACPSGLVEADAPEEPDWASLGTFGGREAAEGPSYLALAAVRVATWTGNTGLLDDHWPYVRRAVLAQQIDEAGRQPWAGDETFRAAMGADFGYPLEYPWQEVSWSANSAFLTVAAAEALLPHAPEEDVPDLEERAALARRAMAETFLQPDGWYAPFVFHTDGPENVAGEVAPAPFEDVNLKLAWLGVLPPDDPTVLSDLAMLEATAGKGEGIFETTPPPGAPDGFGTVDLSAGIGTGMLPGYALGALTRLGHPSSAFAFDALHDYASPTGTYPEALSYEDRAAIQPVYDPSGVLGDFAARYRPWEGGIVGDAMLWWLFGLEPVEDGAALAPRLPRGSTRLLARGLQTPAARLRVRLERDGADVIAEVRSEQTAPFTLHLAVPVTPCGAVRRVDGPASWTIETLPLGERRVVFDPIEVASQEPIRVRVRGAARECRHD